MIWKKREVSLALRHHFAEMVRRKMKGEEDTKGVEEALSAE